MIERPTLDFATRRARLRELVASGRTVAVPGATDALSARLIEEHGFECVYIGSYATAASRYALPDTGLLSLDDLAAHAKSIASAVSVPVIAAMPGATLDDEARAGAAIVLYYGLSALVHYDALDRALATFKATRDAGAIPGYRERVQAFEEFMGYREFAARARR